MKNFKIYAGISSLILTITILGLYGFYRFSHHSRKTHSYDWQAVHRQKNIIPVAIIGSGPAGLSAALYTSRAHLHTVVFQGPQAGGQLMSTSEVENWPGMGKKHGPEIMKSVTEQAQHFGAVLLSDSIKKVNLAVWPFELTTADDTLVHALSIIICSGASPERLTSVPEEKTYWGKGVTACAICDAAFYKDKDVVVVGGGDSAAEQALQLTAYARHITILVRGDKMRASVAMQDRLKKFDYIKIRYNTSITAIEGDGEHVAGVQLKTKDGTERLPIDGIFLAIGHKPNSGLVAGQVQRTQHGYIELDDRTQQTSVEGVFVAGDVADERYRQAAVASGDGVKAALDAERFLQTIGYDEMLAKKIEPRFYDPVILTSGVELVDITSFDQFKKTVLGSSVPVIVDFYTKFCASCLQMMPLVQAVAGQFKDKLICVKVDIEKVPELKERYSVSTVPYFVVIKNGLVVGKYNDIMTKRELVDFASRFITDKS